MRSYSHKPVGVLYEHPEQFNPLFKELRLRDVPYVRINPADYYINPLETDVPYSLLYADLSKPLYCQKSGSAISQTTEYLHHLEINNKGLIHGRLINGSQAINTMSSLTKQLSIFASLGLSFPKTFVVSSLNQLLSVIDDLEFPVLIKQNRMEAPYPTIRVDSMVELIEAIGNDALKLNGRDILLIQEYLRPKGSHTIRVETLNARVIHAVKIFVTGDQVKAWPIVVKKEPALISNELTKIVERIVQVARVEVGSVEFLTDASTNRIYFYGIKPHTYASTVDSQNNTVHTVEMIATYIQQRLLKIMEMELAI